MPEIFSSIACNLDVDIISASLPLLEESKVEAIEWSFDALYEVDHIPEWFTELLQAFSKEKRLIGHGVFFSLFSGRWSEGQSAWLKQLKHICSQFDFDHITEHFGFMTGRDFHQGAPLNIPYSKSTLRIGQDRLMRIYDACRCPVGLENLAFSYSLEEVKRHGEFLERLIDPVNGFIILDLHNLYCQIHNFCISFNEIISLYPLDRIREIHISGGSWESSDTDRERIIRRDTHDNSVPNEVFDLLEITIDKCPNLKYVVLEQLGNGLNTTESRKLFYDDFVRMEKIVRNRKINDIISGHNSFLPGPVSIPGKIIDDETLYQQQLELSSILESSITYNDAIHSLENSSLANSDWRIESWQPYMIETAMKIAQKWM